MQNIKIQRTIVEEINRLLEHPKTMPHLLFYGSPGTGKTTVARSVAREITGKLSPDLYLEINASDNRGIESMRELAINFSKYPSFKGRKVILLDEADYLTNEAQATLRQPMLNYRKNCLFILTCNYVHKLNPAIVSRCKTYEFKSVPVDELKLVLNDICKQRNIFINETRQDLLIKASGGDIRFIENNLYSGNEQIVNNTIPISRICSSSIAELYTLIDSILQKTDSKFLLKNLLKESIQLVIDKTKRGKLILAIAKADLAISQGSIPLVQFMALFEIMSREIPNSTH